jgi:hypothetical protein
VSIILQVMDLPCKVNEKWRGDFFRASREGGGSEFDDDEHGVLNNRLVYPKLQMDMFFSYETRSFPAGQ